MGAVGTLPWLERTGGRLGAADRLAIARQGMAVQLRGLLSRGSDRARVDLDDLRLPDTPAAKEAESEADAMPPFLWAHSHRTYLWGAILAGRDGVSFDEEACYVAALLHDYGLAHPPDDDSCFTTASARRARELAGSVGWPEPRGRAVAEGIALHFNPRVTPEQGLEGYLVNTGAALDVAGVRRREVDRATVEAVLERHPRHRLKEEIVANLKRDAERAPACRPAFMLRYGAFARIIRRAPFAE